MQMAVLFEYAAIIPLSYYSIRRCEQNRGLENFERHLSYFFSFKYTTHDNIMIIFIVV